MQTNQQNFTAKDFWKNRFPNFRLGTIFLFSSFITTITILFLEDYFLIGGLLFVICLPLGLGISCYYQLVKNRLSLKKTEQVLKNPSWTFFIHTAVLELVSSLTLTIVLIVVSILDGGILNWIVMGIAFLDSVALFTAILSFFKFYRLSGGTRFSRSKKS